MSATNSLPLFIPQDLSRIIAKIDGPWHLNNSRRNSNLPLGPTCQESCRHFLQLLRQLIQAVFRYLRDRKMREDNQPDIASATRYQHLNCSLIMTYLGKYQWEISNYAKANTLKNMDETSKFSQRYSISPQPEYTFIEPSL